MSNTNNITDIELQAYIDNELDSVKHAEIEALIQQDEELQSRVNDYQKINKGLQQLFQQPAEDIIPERHRKTVKPKTSFITIKYAQVASILVAVFTGVIIGWFSRGEVITQQLVMAPQNNQIVQDAFSYHAVYTPEVKHPVEVTSEHEEHLFKWLSKRLDTEVNAPDFTSSGFYLLGGRLLSSDEAPAAQFMYENDLGERLTLFTRQKKKDEPDITEFQYARKNGMNGFYWTDKNLSFVILSEISKNKIYELVSKVCNTKTLQQ